MINSSLLHIYRESLEISQIGPCEKTTDGKKKNKKPNIPISANLLAIPLYYIKLFTTFECCTTWVRLLIRFALPNYSRLSKLSY